MMEVPDFERAKRAIIEDMFRDKIHCANSVVAVRRCTGLHEFVEVLNKFQSELKNKRFPNIATLRAHFLGELAELNRLGVYIDQEVDITNQGNVWLFGNCKGTVRSDVPRFVNIVVNDDAEVNIDAMRWGLQNIYIKSPEDVLVKFHKSTTATQLITKLDKKVWNQST